MKESFVNFQVNVNNFTVLLGTSDILKFKEIMKSSPTCELGNHENNAGTNLFEELQHTYLLSRNKSINAM